MKRRVFFVIILFLFNGCKGKDKSSAGLLSAREMQEVMWDMVRAGEFLNGFIIYKDTATDGVAESQKWYKKVYELHGITEEKFRRSYTYYEKRPEIMKVILDSLTRKPVYSRPKEPDTSASETDTTIKSPFPSIDTRIRTGDSLEKRRLLQKVFKGR